jgi:hypothetical protein
MPTPYQLDLTAAQIEQAVNAAYDSAGAPTSGSTKLVQSGAIYSWVLGLLGSKVEVVSAPVTSDASGTAGQVAYDADYFYVCVGVDTWKRVALSSW